MSVSDRLKTMRELLGKTQKEMASLTGISYRTWQNYEDGVNSPGWDACEALVKLGFNANWLLTGEGEMMQGTAVEAITEVQMEIKKTNIAGRSPIKQAAVSYIDSMADIDVPKVISFILSTQPAPQQDVEYDDEDQRLRNMSPEGKKELRAILEERIKKAREDEHLSGQAVLRPTGT